MLNWSEPSVSLYAEEASQRFPLWPSNPPFYHDAVEITIWWSALNSEWADVSSIEVVLSSLVDVHISSKGRYCSINN